MRRCAAVCIWKERRNEKTEISGALIGCTREITETKASSRTVCTYTAQQDGNLRAAFKMHMPDFIMSFTVNS